MASWGLVRAHGKSLAPQSLHQLFTNPFYAGILVDPWSGEEVPGKHPPLVTREEFAQAQRVIAPVIVPSPTRKIGKSFPCADLRCEHADMAHWNILPRAK